MQLQNLQAELAELIVTDDQHTDIVAPVENLSIYHNTALAALMNTLKDIYPLVCKLLGEDFFRITIQKYIKQYPSRSGNLHDYGEYFSDFLAHFQPLKELVYIPEVAQFEWHCHTLFYAAAHDAMNPALLETFTPEQYDHLHFVLHPAAKIMKCHFPILKIIDLCKDKIIGSIDVDDGGVNLLIIRRELDISLVELTTAEFTFLDMLQENKSLAEALNTTLLIDPQFKLAEKLPAWVKDKTLVDCMV